MVLDKAFGHGFNSRRLQIHKGKNRSNSERAIGSIPPFKLIN